MPDPDVHPSPTTDPALAAALARVAATLPDLDLAVSTGEPDAVPVSGLPSALPRWIDEDLALWPGLDRRTAAVLLAGQAAYPIGLTLVALHLAGAPHPFGPDEVTLLRLRFPLGDSGRTGTRFAVRIRPDVGGRGADTGDPALRSLERVLDPLMDAVAATGPLRRGNLQRIVGDAVAIAHLAAGRAFRAEAAARDDALRRLRVHRSPIASPRTGFVAVRAERPDGEPAEQWFVDRAACCRLHEHPAFEACDTCPRRSADDRTARLKRFST
ncbi:hypothetical protein [Chthonobacter rhizosphaerae]|uniref:hypothetical protein n=1 Tax=Chthonobacter rhizosphaerae TaxID=2735553 RepID=UPI0015EE4B36|nr:hypothetical protein [Chthonobacter rhizosphaerae]